MCAQIPLNTTLRDDIASGYVSYEYSTRPGTYRVYIAQLHLLSDSEAATIVMEEAAPSGYLRCSCKRPCVCIGS